MAKVKKNADGDMELVINKPKYLTLKDLKKITKGLKANSEITFYKDGHGWPMVKGIEVRKYENGDSIMVTLL